MELIKENEKGITYQCDGFRILYRNKGSISGDNNINKEEKVYLISGKVEFVIDKDRKIHEAPCEIEIPERTYHKIIAITDISLIIFFV